LPTDETWKDLFATGYAVRMIRRREVIGKALDNDNADLLNILE
jgi:hypothetical protein